MTTHSQNFRPRTVSSTYLQAFVYGAAKMGVPKDKVLLMIPGGENALTNPVKRFDYKTLIEILNFAIEHSGDRTMGLRIGLNFRQEHFLDVGYALPFASSLKEVIELNEAHQTINQQIGRTSFNVIDGKVHMSWNSFSGETEYEKFYTESIFAGYASLGRWLLRSQDNPIQKMRFRHKKPRDMAVHNVVFGEDIEFESDRDELIYPAVLLKAKMPSPNPQVFNLLRSKLSRKMSDLNQPTKTSVEALRLVQAGLAREDVSINRIADRMGMSERTFRRRLKDEGTSFRDVLSDARKELCEIYFNENRMSLSQIAQSLGFQDQSAFSRAFKGWYGMSPRQYKSELGN